MWPETNAKAGGALAHPRHVPREPRAVEQKAGRRNRFDGQAGNAHGRYPGGGIILRSGYLPSHRE
jgi:hypothetical protein